MRQKTYLLFDAGGTLVWPNQSFLIEQAEANGLNFSHEQLYNAYYHLIYELDDQTRQRGQMPEVWPNGYTWALLELLGVDGQGGEAVIAASQAFHREHNLWSFSFEWIPETLARLSEQGYRMSVISNADGRAEQILERLGLAGYFERIFDSAVVGIKKPDPAIFKLALRELNLSPAEAIYIGDVFYIDVVGANRAGLEAVHLDPLGLYQGWPGTHLADVRQLIDWLPQKN